MKFSGAVALLAVVPAAMAAHGPRCTAFCNEYLTRCNGTQTLSATYTNPNGVDGATELEMCVNQCASFSLASPAADYSNGEYYDPATDGVVAAGDSFDCRYYHASVASGDETTAEDHCSHANPASLLQDGNDGPCTDGVVSPECENYCGQWNAVCSQGGNGWLYPSKAHCLAACATFDDTGARDQIDFALSPSEGNTLACRRYHQSVAFGGTAVYSNDYTIEETAAAIDTHCPHATLGDGVCGDTCDAFCDVVIAGCTGDNVQWATKEDCMDDCANIPAAAAADKKASSTWDTAVSDQQDNIECRFYHAVVALEGTDNAADIHCSHTAVESVTCVNAAASAIVPSALLVAALAYSAME